MALVLPSQAALGVMSDETQDRTPATESATEASQIGRAGSPQLEGQDDRNDLLAVRDGDEAAARRLLSRHGSSMMRTAWRVLGSYGSSEADDVVQEAMIAALTTAALPTGDVGAWLRAIVVRKALDALRRSRRREEQPLTQVEGEGRQPTARDELGGALDVITVRKALGQLSPSDRAVLTLVDLEGWPMAEAAKMLGITHVAIKLRASRARRKLARMIREGGAGGTASDRTQSV